MSTNCRRVLGLCVIGLWLVMSAHVQAATANGPYYATPSWDQQLPSSTRFIVLSNWGSAAVLDRETGLVWERTPEQFLDLGWKNAHEWCLGRSIGGRKGWRLPSIQELSSLIDPAASSPALPPGHPFVFVTGTPGARMYTWSSTTAGDTIPVGVSAWAMDFSDGRASFTQKNLPIGDGFFPQVWCVRGGSGIDTQ